METTDFIYKNPERILPSGVSSWKSPSNIALIKYWGKVNPQIPKNPSLSLTLDACATYTKLEYYPTEEKGNSILFDVYFDSEKNDNFKPKITIFFNRIKEYVPFIFDYKYVIRTRNTFPHSSGIASSASGMSALALCIMQIEKELNPLMTDEYFYKKASFLARLGSGSAARSVKGSVVIWGEHKEISESSDLYGVEFPKEIHPIFKNFHDTILLVDKGQKQVSSTLGHRLMENHPYAENRFSQARRNLSELNKILQKGAIKEFIKIVESEALTLHAMMMTSNPYFILMQPNTLAIIHKIWNFRKETKMNICFTLDAGANVHVLYPEKDKEQINNFIVNELTPYCQNNQYICDRIGEGSKPLANDIIK